MWFINGLQNGDYVTVNQGSTSGVLVPMGVNELPFHGEMTVSSFDSLGAEQWSGTLTAGSGDTVVVLSDYSCEVLEGFDHYQAFLAGGILVFGCMGLLAMARRMVRLLRGTNPRMEV